MSNPSPQHNPTDGLNVAAYVQLTGTNLTNPSGGALTVSGEDGGNGQGIGAVASTDRPNAQYALTLSLSASGGFATTCQLTVVLKDVANTTYTPDGSPVYISYNNPSAGSPSWYNPSNFSDGTVSYDADVASVSSSGLITGLAVGEAIIEVMFPTFDNTLGDQATADTPDPQSYNPTMKIYALVIVTVIP